MTTDTEPDAIERAALGEALTEPVTAEPSLTWQLEQLITEVDEYGHERWRYGEKATTAGRGSLIEHADALDWLAARKPDSATAVIFDPPYSRYSPMRGREDGAAGSVSAPFTFMHQTLRLCARAVKPKGIVVAFGDWKLLPDLEYLCSITGLREQSHLAWCRSRPGGGGLFRGACDPVLIASRTPPARVDKAALKNWFLADYEIPRSHPYSKPPQLIEYILRRVCRPGDVVLDPFAGSGSSRVAARKLGLEWLGADIDPQYAETGEDL